MTLNNMLDVGYEFYLIVEAYLEPKKFGAVVDIFDDVNYYNSDEDFERLKNDFGDCKVEQFICGDNHQLVIRLDTEVGKE